jgi:hypothetical protein
MIKIIKKRNVNLAVPEISIISFYDTFFLNKIDAD